MIIRYGDAARGDSVNVVHLDALFRLAMAERRRFFVRSEAHDMLLAPFVAPDICRAMG